MLSANPMALGGALGGRLLGRGLAGEGGVTWR